MNILHVVWKRNEQRRSDTKSRQTENDKIWNWQKVHLNSLQNDRMIEW